MSDGRGAYPSGPLGDAQRCLCCQDRTPGGGICDRCNRAACTFGAPRHVAPAMIVCDDSDCEPYGEHYQRLHGQAARPDKEPS